MIIYKDIITNKGNDLDALSGSFPIILVFLRHFECVFCKESIRDLASRRAEIESKNKKVVFVHMSDNQTADSYFKQYDFEGAEHISDPKCELYRQFGLSKGSFSQLFGLKVWSRGFELRKTGLNMNFHSVGDSLQMPGIFAIYKGEIKESYIHRSIADKPNYENFINCCQV